MHCACGEARLMIDSGGNPGDDHHELNKKMTSRPSHPSGPERLYDQNPRNQQDTHSQYGVKTQTSSFFASGIRDVEYPAAFEGKGQAR